MPSGIYKHKSLTEEHKRKISLSKIGSTHETSIETRKKISLAKIGKKRLPYSDEWKKNMSMGIKGKKKPQFTEEHKKKIGDARRGEKHYRYIQDRTKLKKSENKMNDSIYMEWVKNIYKRDNWKCKINNQDYKGKIEAHHILPWRDFSELRYNLDNRITLCHFHHPRKHKDEKLLSPYFKQLIK